MPQTHRWASLVAALACISCAEPVPPPLRAPVIASAPLDLPEQSCQGSAPLPRVGGPSVRADDGTCESRRGEVFVFRPPRLDGRYDFGHAPALRDLDQGTEGRELDMGHPLPSPTAAQRCGYHLLNKVIVPFCVHGSN
jgi:hypothetical protein